LRADLSFKRWLGVGVAALAVVVAGCGSATVSRPAARQVVQNATVSFALPPNVTPNYIFPLVPLGNFSVYNAETFSYLMWMPLYWFGNHGAASFNPGESLAQPAVFSTNAKGDSVATITLKPGLKWSDGKPVTTRDVRFWMNLLKTAVKLAPTNWGAFVPGNFPDNVSSIAYNSASKMTLTFNGHYNTYWLLYNELSQMYPIPQHLWDRTSLGGPVGNYDLTTAGATKVYNFLTAQSKTLSTYSTNRLWKVVDGPFLLSRYISATGYTVLSANSRYSGSDKPTIAKLIEQPYTSDTAEFDALRAGQVDYGYIPTADLAQRATLARHGYTFKPWLDFGIVYFPVNFTNPSSGRLFKQLYLRQAIQHLVNQPLMISKIFKGYASPTYGPVPANIANPFLSPYEKDNPYPYNPSAALRLLKSHGWTVHPNGISTCASPGTGAGHCGAGVASGAQLQFNLQYASGNATTTQEMEALQSSLSQAGIKINLSEAPFNTVISTAVPCNAKTGAGCKWDMENWGGGWVYVPDYMPTGGEIFAGGAASNNGGYNNPINNNNIKKTHTANGYAAMFNYENYMATNLPVVWIPNQDYSLSEVKNTLRGWDPQDPYLNIYPQDWYLTKK